ncbi:MAG: hypothetical protein ACM3UR_02695 [Bacteroidota bacterium]|jgi:hypothetical protein|nr:hypothetical protein [Ignavibacteria bacterium]MCU7501353.1 hypothetical protein [Ignavibacteria bacterium]MCU7514661.1 hypothetical protein [Ignavibacteria bacterium]MCU7522215.1 hypothetical protein [Ignavibacteria bacterium]MCU7526548.1 hypothetical protein [Ignavibacteria bacterium]
MNDVEKKKLGMYESVLTLLAENKDITSTVRSFNSTITKLRKAMDEIRRTEKALSSEILDKTILNARAKDNLITALVPVISSLFNYARQTNNLELREKTRFTQSHLVRMLDSELIKKAEGTYLLAEKYMAMARIPGLNNRTLADLSAQTDAFRNTLAKKISSLIDSSTVMFMNDLFNNADSIMTQMDKFVEQLTEEYEEFYDEYIYARDLENQDQVKAMMELEEEDEEE